MENLFTVKYNLRSWSIITLFHLHTKNVGLFQLWKTFNLFRRVNREIVKTMVDAYTSIWRNSAGIIPRSTLPYTCMARKNWIAKCRGKGNCVHIHGIVLFWYVLSILFIHERTHPKLCLHFDSSWWEGGGNIYARAPRRRGRLDIGIEHGGY